jgi:hypothetical protein
MKAKTSSQTHERDSLPRRVRHRPTTWERPTGIKILYPDGWRDGTSWLKPLTREEWNKRMRESTRSYPCKVANEKDKR